METGYAHSESAVLLCNTWDLVVSEGSGDVLLVIGNWVLMTDDLRAAPLRQAPLDELNSLIAFVIGSWVLMTCWIYLLHFDF